MKIEVEMFLVKTNGVIFPFLLDYHFSKGKKQNKREKQQNVLSSNCEKQSIGYVQYYFKYVFLELVSKDLKILVCRKNEDAK